RDRAGGLPQRAHALLGPLPGDRRGLRPAHPGAARARRLRGLPVRAVHDRLTAPPAGYAPARAATRSGGPAHVSGGPTRVRPPGNPRHARPAGNPPHARPPAEPRRHARVRRGRGTARSVTGPRGQLPRTLPRTPGLPAHPPYAGHAGHAGHAAPPVTPPRAPPAPDRTPRPGHPARTPATPPPCTGARCPGPGTTAWPPRRRAGRRSRPAPRAPRCP